MGPVPTRVLSLPQGREAGGEPWSRSARLQRRGELGEAPLPLWHGNLLHGNTAGRDALRRGTGQHQQRGLQGAPGAGGREGMSLASAARRVPGGMLSGAGTLVRAGKRVCLG